MKAEELNQTSNTTGTIRRASRLIGKTAGVFMALVAALANLPTRADMASEPAGFYRVTCLSNSDTIVSIPFTRPPAASGLVESVAGNVVTLQGAPNWTENQFVYSAGIQPNTYYVRFESGPKEGFNYLVTASGSNTLTCELGADDLTAVTNGTRLAVIPYWTLASAFPNGQGMIPSTTTFNRRMEILIPDFDGAGVNLGIRATYYYFSTGGTNHWRLFGNLNTNMDDEILLPDIFFIVRNNTSTNTVFTARGIVPETKLAVPLVATASGKQDNYIALTRPVSLTLNASGLVQSGAFSASPTTFNRIDELFVFNNDVPGKNKAAAATYYFYDGAWRKFGDLTGDHGEEPVFLPGSGVIIRKGAGTTTTWINSPTY